MGRPSPCISPHSPPARRMNQGGGHAFNARAKSPFRFRVGAVRVGPKLHAIGADLWADGEGLFGHKLHEF
jgi:hypothetical protein